MIRRILVIVMASVVLISSFAGLREYRKRQWTPDSEAWLTECATGLAPTTGVSVAKRVCACQLEYISVRWTPASYHRQYERIHEEMGKTGVYDDCIDLAAGYANRRP
jgi:hypothetical protein